MFFCIFKAGFNITPVIDECEDDSSVEVVPCSSEYLYCDDDLVCFGPLNEQDILEAVAQNNFTAEGDLTVHNEADCEIFADTKEMSTKEVLDSVENLRKYCSENEIETNFIFDKIEDQILKMFLKKKQSKITDFFK